MSRSYFAASLAALLCVASFASAEAPPAGTMAADDLFDADEMAAVRERLWAEHGAQRIGFFLLERFEVGDGGGAPLGWEAQGWYGTDRWRAVLETEGERGDEDEAEIMLGVRRAWRPFWDLEAGVRHDDDDAQLALGVRGLAPYWFEVAGQFFIDGEGDTLARLELEYDWRLRQRLLLQPRVQLDLALMDDGAVRGGDLGVEVGLRLRLERNRFAPYLGVEWEQALERRPDAGRRGWKALVGVRAWL